MAGYKFTSSGVEGGVMRYSDGAIIPNDPGNRDWKKYLAYIDGGGLTDPYKTQDELITDKETEAKKTRDKAISLNIIVLDCEWQVREQDLTFMERAVDTAEREGYPPESTQGWILADNSIRETTAEELGQVLTVHALRVKNIFGQYALWRVGAKLIPFTIST